MRSENTHHQGIGCANGQFFENLPKMIRPKQVAEILGLSIETIYDWKYRAKLKRVPEGLFIKLNRTLYLRTDVLKEWIASQNPSLQ